MPNLTFKDPQGRAITINSPDGSTPSEGELDQLFSMKYGGPTQASSKDYSNYQPNRIMTDPNDKSLLGRAQNFSANAINNFADVGDAAINTGKNIIQHPLQSAGNAIGGLANAASHPIDTLKGIGSDLVSKIQNAPNRPVDALLTGASAGMLAEGGAGLLKNPKTYEAIGSAGKAIGNAAGKLKPTIYNDELIANTTKSAISKIENAVKPLKEKYTSIESSYADQPVDGKVFQEALSVVPSEYKKDFIRDFSSQILDANGNPTTTIGNLKKMEIALKQGAYEPVQPYGSAIKGARYDAAKGAGKIKELRLSQLPNDVSSQIKILDRQFGPAIEASDALLPKLADKNGIPNTRFLFKTFKDPASAGMRDYLKGLKSIGIDLMPEIKTTRGWVARQGLKNLGNRIAGRVVEGGVIGGILKGH